MIIYLLTLQKCNLSIDTTGEQFIYLYNLNIYTFLFLYIRKHLLSKFRNFSDTLEL